MTSAALPFLYVAADVPEGLTLTDFRRHAVALTVPDPRSPAMNSTVVLRRPYADEAATVRKIAYLDSARPLDGDVFVAVLDDQIVAAASLDDGRVVADPFFPSGHVAGMLRDHIGRLQEHRPATRSPRVRRLRLHPAR